jgi:hypothetical protein
MHTVRSKGNSISPDPKRQKGQITVYGFHQHTKAHAGLQAPRITSTCIHFKVHASILALPTLPSLQLTGFALTHSPYNPAILNVFPLASCLLSHSLPASLSCLSVSASLSVSLSQLPLFSLCVSCSPFLYVPLSLFCSYFRMAMSSLLPAMSSPLLSPSALDSPPNASLISIIKTFPFTMSRHQFIQRCHNEIHYA